MIFSLKHLNTYLPSVKLNSSIEQVINNIGFEVESIEKFSDVKGIKFALVKKFYKNPNSDNLFVAELKLADKDLVIQTTDGVLQDGDLVVCFPPGSSKGNIVFGDKKLKGIVSQGMMASFSELGYKTELLGESAKHLIRLDNSFATLSDDPMEILGVNDYILDVSATSNRNDANSYQIFAKELSAYFESNPLLKNRKVEGDFVSKMSVDKGNSEELTMFEAKRQSKIETPLLEKLLLAKHDFLVNEDWAVNLTNLCLIETGSPAHVYDRSKLGNKITTSIFSGSLNILGHKKVDVKNILVVNDENKPLSIASVMGLEDSKVTLDSENLVFEIGNFDSKLVREAATQIKLSSASSNQASKTVTKDSLIRGINFLRSYLNDKKASVSNILGIPKDSSKKSIVFDKSKLEKYAGVKKVKTEFNKAINKLKKLDFIFVDDKVIIPKYRYDIELFEDIIEEIFRFYSYENFKPAQPFSRTFKVQKSNNLNLNATYLGYSEVRTYSLISKEKNFLNPFNFDAKIGLLTYVSKEREEIRNSIIPSFLEVIIHNKKREINNINIFEKGMINNNIFVFGFATTTKSFLEFKKDIIDFYKSDNLVFKPFDDNEYIHPNYSAKIYENDSFIGWIGKIHPAYDNSNSLVAEIFMPKNSTPIKYSEIDYSPLKYIDLTFSLDLRDQVGKIIDKINEKYNVYEIIKKDVYIKDNLKNITLRITANSETIKNINKEYNS